MSVTQWCDLLDLAHVGKNQRLAFKRLPADRITGRNHNNGKHLIHWKRGSIVEAPDWDESASCGGGLHVSPTASATRDYSSEGLVVPVAFDPKDAVLLGDKAKVRRCKVLG
jgi:hypothetical protein